MQNDTKPKVYFNKYPNKPEPTIYNEAEMVMYEEAEKEIVKYVPSKIMNDDPDGDRIILINNLQNRLTH